MKRNSSEYWEERIAQKVWGTYNSIEERNIRLLEMYQDAARDISNELYALGQKLGKDGVLSRSDMYKQGRLTEIKRKIEKTMEGLGQEAESFAKDNMNAGYKDTLQTTAKQLGGIDYALPNKKVMEEMLDRPWHGSNFSDRLWNNTESLSAALNDSLVRGIEQGKTTTEMAIEIANAMQSGFNVTHRLVRTETIHFLNSAAIQGYKHSGVKKVQYWAAEDERTCDECGDGGYHGRIFPIDKAPILPLHPNCRCTYLPVVYEELTYEEEYAVTKYVSPDSYVLNDKLRRKTELTPAEKQWIMELEKALNKLPCYNGDLNRSLTFVYEDEAKQFFENLETGSEYIPKQYLSTTKQGVYNDSAQVQIYIQNAKNGRDLGSLNDMEKEVLYPLGSKFKVLNKMEAEGKYFILLEEE